MTADKAAMDPVVKSVHLACDRRRAFTLFTEQISEWWPPERKHLKDADSVLVLTREHFRERAVDGRQVELGRVREWAPPERIVLDFYPGTDAEHPTDVTITFLVEGEGTRVTVEHRPTASSADLWLQRAPAFVRSWDLVLPALVARAAAR